MPETTPSTHLQSPERGPPTRELTFGEKAVGVTFNPSKNEAVDEIKRVYADIIDGLHFLRGQSTGEKARLASIAITEAQGAQMWAVKAVTWTD
jgi:hypothetical protein